jgi:ABC-type glycerol-3-phosphate transport system permease component
LALGLQNLTNQLEYDANYPLLFAAMVVSIIPVIVLFCIFQKTIMENTIAGGLKG